MANGFLNGSDLLIYIGTGQTATPIAHSRSCSISLSTNMADATTKTNDGFTEVIPTTKSWEFSNDGLATWGGNVQLFMNAFNDRTPLEITFKPTNVLSGSTIYTGTAYLESLDISAEMEDGVTFSAKLKGSGPLNFVTV